VGAKRGIHAALVSVVLCWGLVFVGIARLLPQIDAVQLVTIRFTLIALVFALIFVVVPSTRPHIRTARDWWIFIAMGVLAVPGSQLTIVNGQKYLSPPLVSLVVTTSPAWAAIIAAIFLKEKINALQIAGFATALGGVTVIIVAGTGTSGFEVDNPWGAMLTVLSPICWALYTVVSKTQAGKYGGVTAVGLAMITGSLAMIPVWPHAIEGLGEITPTGWGWMAFLVIGGTVVPYLVWWRALGVLSAGATTAYMYGIPLAALLWSWAVLGTAPTLLALVGGGIVICGVAMIQFGRRNRTPEPVEPAVS
jgi:drug/metabolite transporter (DMT)-like permease